MCFFNIVLDNKEINLRFPKINCLLQILMRKKIFYLPVILFLSAFFVGCDDDDDGNSETEAWRIENERFFNELGNRSDLYPIEAESGKGKIYYKIIKSGDANSESPVYTSAVYVHYYGATLDGFDTKADTIVKADCFDTSYKGANLLPPTEEYPASNPQYKPAYFPKAGNLIEGWWIALQEMVPGDKWQLYIPQELGYGTSGSGDAIPGYSTLIFEVELVSFIK